MMFPDFVDLLREFSAAGVEFLVVGAHALSVYGHIRATKDLDVWVRPDRENGLRMLTALAEFGAPLEGLDADDVAGGDVVFQIGVPPVRIDILTNITGVTFDEAWSSRMVTTIAGVSCGVLSRDLLIRNKRATGRLQDLADVEWLVKHPHGES